MIAVLCIGCPGAIGTTILARRRRILAVSVGAVLALALVVSVGAVLVGCIGSSLSILFRTILLDFFTADAGFLTLSAKR